MKSVRCRLRRFILFLDTMKNNAKRGWDTKMVLLLHYIQYKISKTEKNLIRICSENNHVKDITSIKYLKK